MAQSSTELPIQGFLSFEHELPHVWPETSEISEMGSQDPSSLGQIVNPGYEVAMAVNSLWRESPVNLTFSTGLFSSEFLLLFGHEKKV